ncbi:hypothetical protein Ddye_017095 [Dipteronia dyeriana]|uniref:Uncharacterized protein n=1 Tax=Dipteronia dyeriana TaxID=168575 RepID=A0AAD9X066_9ROSI|nr:hypothetical protein Ddye_017095 [Dipteronia dyeriana]
MNLTLFTIYDCDRIISPLLETGALVEDIVVETSQSLTAAKNCCPCNRSLNKQARKAFEVDEEKLASIE